MKGNKKSENGITLVALIITIIILIILAAVTIKVVTDMKIIQFAIKGTEDYSKAQDKEMADFGKIENLLTDTISNIESGNTPITPSEPEGPDNPFTDADIGKYVNYVPQGTDYTVEAKYSGHTEDQVFRQNTSLKWQIWKVENDTLYLISDGVPSTSGYNNVGHLCLKDVQGYNNGVTLLDSICQYNYGISGNNNVKVQNLKLEDILAVKADSIEPQAASIYGTQPTMYPGASTDYCYFPCIWYNNERENLEAAIDNRSKAYSLVEIEDRMIREHEQYPYFTRWYNASMNDIGAWKSEKYYNMVLKANNGDRYWLSSRSIYPNGSQLEFGLQSITAWNNSWGCIFEYLISTGTNWGTSIRNNGIRPIVQIPLTECKITSSNTEGMDFDITIK